MTGRSKPGTAPAKPADTALEPVPDQAGASPEAPAAPAAPTPITNMILADLVLRGGSALLRRAVDAQLLGRPAGAVLDKVKGATGGKTGGKADKIIKGRTMGQTLLGTMAVRIATRSVPGAIIVGGGLLAKALYDRKRAKARKPD